jgi:hypothetical protein
MSQAGFVPPPMGRPPVNNPEKLLKYLRQLAQHEGKNPDAVKVPGANAPTESQVEFPGTLKPSVAEKIQKLPTHSVPQMYESAPKAVVHEHESDKEVISRIADRFDMLHTIARGACTGTSRAVIVSGAGGVGKTYTIEKILEYYRETKNIQSEIVHGVLTPVNLYMLLYRNRTQNCVVLLDDADTIFWDENALSILKAALDSSPVRTISYMSESKALKSNDVPTTFQYEGAMIFITNLDFQGIVDAGKGKTNAHFQALMTRALYLDLKLHSARDLTLWINHMVTKNHILVQAGLTQDQEKEVLGYMNENRDRLRNLSLRTALKIASFVKMNPQNWRKMAMTIEMR